MKEVVLWYFAMCLVIGVVAYREDRFLKKISQGYKPNAKDGDKDGLVQEGTRWERKVKK